jgi:DNA polymerase III alpha subunit (gram-positive type)
MKSIKLPIEVENAVKEMGIRGYGSRKVANEINKKFGISHSHRYYCDHYPEFFSKRVVPKTSLTLNIEPEILDRIQRQVETAKQSMRKRIDLNNIINDRLKDWLNRTAPKDRANQILIALKKRATEFKDGRRKYRKTVKKTIRIRKEDIREKDVLKSLKTVQEEIDKQTHEFLVREVKPNKKASLEKSVELMIKKAELEEEEAEFFEAKHKPIVSIAQIINIILDLELQ